MYLHNHFKQIKKKRSIWLPEINKKNYLYESVEQNLYFKIAQSAGAVEYMTESLQRGRIVHTMCVLYMTQNNLMVRFQ